MQYFKLIVQSSDLGLQLSTAPKARQESDQRGITMPRMDLRDYQLGHDNLNVSNADGISGRHTGNLDSKNGEAVMDLMRELHQNGATICTVTHDPRYERCAERTVHLFDGRIVDETEAAAMSEMS